MERGRGRGGGGVVVEIGVGRGGTGGIRMGMRGVIGGIDRRINHGIGLEIGQGVGDRIDESVLGATRGGEMMIDRPDGRENEAIRLIYLDGEDTLEIEIMTIDDETKYAVLNESCTLTA